MTPLRARGATHAAYLRGLAAGSRKVALRRSDQGWWYNMMIETSFGIITLQGIRRGSFTSVKT